MQTSTDHARKYCGTGLGLVIFKQLVCFLSVPITDSSKIQS
jgi:signal transduction histidine kinase